jgi:adenylosuccinate synthase
MTHLDVLGQFDEIPVCVGYRCDGEEVADFPNQIELLARCEPVYETLPGWKSDTSQAKRFDDLPANAQAYVRHIGELVGAPVSHVLVGKQRDQSIVL